MTKTQKKRFMLFSLVGLTVAIAILLIMYALSQNINLFYTPTEIKTGVAPTQTKIRVGGMVVKGSVTRNPDDLRVSFDLTDFKHTVTVSYQGILPDLFREGQGIVALGRVNQDTKFMADEVLAKHDENYMPPEAALAIERAKEEP